MSRSDMTILNESFNIYYNDGMRALEIKITAWHIEILWLRQKRCSNWQRFPPRT